MPDQDAFATARGNAFVATANDPAAVFYNPAGMAQLSGFNVSLGGYGYRNSDHYNGPEGSLYSKTIWSALPQVFATYHLTNHPLSFGLGFYSPFGWRMSWPSAYVTPLYFFSLQPPVPYGQTERLDYFTIATMTAWQICPSLSLAAGPTINYSSVNLRNVFGVFPPLPPGTGAAESFGGDALAAGYTVGLLYHPNGHHFIGLTYRSATEMNYKGYATFAAYPPVQGRDAGASADFYFPETVAVGYSYRPDEKWNLEVDVNWTDWNTLKNVAWNASPSLAYVDTLPFNWKPSWIADFGVTRYLPAGWRLSAGYSYRENSVPNGDVQSWIPDSDRHVFSLGLGQTRGRFSWDAAYQVSWGPAVSGGEYFVSQPPGGKYEFIGQALTLNLGWHF